MENNYEHQCQFSKSNIYDKFGLYSEREGKVGIMSSFLFKSSQNYQIGYLNALIHGLLTASSTFEIYSSVENKFSNAEISRIISG